MGITAYFKILSDEEVRRLRTHPEDVDDVLFPESEDDNADPFEGQGFLEKAWHPIHYILSGSSDPTNTPLGQAVLGGEPLGSDLGYGCARLVTYESVIAISDALQQFDFRHAYEVADKSPEKLVPLYLGNQLAQEYDYLAHYYPSLVDVYRRSASTGSCILAYDAKLCAQPDLRGPVTFKPIHINQYMSALGRAVRR